MPAPVVQFRVWAGTEWDWSVNGPDTPYTELETLRDEWVAQCNLNTTVQPSPILKLKGWNDATGNYKGWVYQFPQAVSARGLSLYYSSYTTSTTARVFGAASHWTDNTNNQGYGSLDSDPQSNAGVYPDSKGWEETGVAGNDYRLMVAYDSTPGQEFFCHGYNLANDDAKQDGLAIFRDRQGAWQFSSFDSKITEMNMSVYDIDHDEQGHDSQSDYNLFSARQDMQTAVVSLPGCFNQGPTLRRKYAICANPYLMNTGSLVTCGAWFAHPSGDAVVKMAKYGHCVRYTPV